MAVETLGTVRIKSDSGPGVRVDVFVDDVRIRLVSGNELIGEWELAAVGVHVLDNGFSIRADGEEFLLRTEDDVAIAEQLGVATSTPRMARKVAASHNPADQPTEPEETDDAESNLPAIGYALAGALILAGGFFLNLGSSASSSPLDSDGDYWIAFIAGGVLMVGVAYLIATGSEIARVASMLVLVGLIVVFGFAARDALLDADDLLAYGFIAGGIVVGVAAVFSTGLRGGDNTG